MPKNDNRNWLLLILKAVVSTVILAGIVMWILHNVKNNNYFFTTSLHNIVILVISVMITYYLVQRRLDDRRKKDGLVKIVEKIISSIQDNVAVFEKELLINKDYSADANVSFESQWMQFLSNTRFISNKIDALKQVCASIAVIKHVMYIEESFKSLKTLGENILISYVRNSTSIPADRVLEIQRLQNDIVSKCDAILTEIYSI